MGNTLHCKTARRCIYLLIYLFIKLRCFEDSVELKCEKTCQTNTINLYSIITLSKYSFYKLNTITQKYYRFGLWILHKTVLLYSMASLIRFNCRMPGHQRAASHWHTGPGIGICIPWIPHIRTVGFACLALAPEFASVPEGTSIRTRICTCICICVCICMCLCIRVERTLARRFSAMHLDVLGAMHLDVLGRVMLTKGRKHHSQGGISVYHDRPCRFHPSLWLVWLLLPFLGVVRQFDFLSFLVFLVVFPFPLRFRSLFSCCPWPMHVK